MATRQSERRSADRAAVAGPTPSFEGVGPVERRLFESLDAERRGYVTRRDLLRRLQLAGFAPDDCRLRECTRALASYGDADPISPVELSAAVSSNIVLVERALQANLVIPDFPDFSRRLQRIYDEVRDVRDGDVARYIPQLARVDPDLFGVAACTVDGQRLAIGDATADFCVQSCCKPINYCLALEEHGEETVHRYVGREPSGRGFNELSLDHERKPHNPMINSGAIMCCSLVRRGADPADRFDFVMSRWRDLCGGAKARFSNAVYLSERATADRNFALGYFMRECGAFPEGTDLISTLEFYFQCCSIEVDAEQMAVAAATLANGGVCPTTGRRILSPRTVQHCLSLMYSCGMYDFSGEFAFSIGLPAKSGVAGVLMVVVPNVMGLCVYSPRIDRQGNSVRGVAFCRRLVETFNFHNYDNLTGLSEKVDPRRDRIREEADSAGAMILAAAKGDLTAIQQLVARGAALSTADYDGRTPLHLAASEGHTHVVDYLLGAGVDPSPRDRWGGTPLTDARRHGHEAVAALLGERGATG